MKLSKKQFLVISLMLFSMFFGAGNFIFPPMVGKEAGLHVYEAILFFCLTAVALPVLGIASVAKSHSLERLINRVDVRFGLIFTILLYITIGPAFAIPRAANMPFEITVMPLLSEGSKMYGLLTYTIIYFVVNYLICIKPNRAVEVLGKFLTPLLLLMIFVLFITSMIFPIGQIGAATGKYASYPIATGFIDGYQTMDALASLVFATVVVNSIKSLGFTSNKAVVMPTIKAGVLAGVILMAIYMILAYIGATTSLVFADTKNGAEILSKVTYHIFGDFGRLFLGVVFLLACLTTTVGLITSASDYFSKLLPKTSYKFWVVAWTFLSFAIANVGLQALLTYSIPVLYALYPITIVLIVLGLINNFIDSSKLIYRSCVYLVTFLGILSGLDAAKISIPVISDLAHKLPLYDSGLSWILPEIICFIVTYIIFVIRKPNI